MLPLFTPRTPFFDGEPAAGGGAPPAPAPAPAAPPAAAPPAAPAAAPTAPSFDDWLKDPLNAEFTKQIRKEAADYRTKFQSVSKTSEDLLRNVASQLGIEIPGGTVDPKQIQDELAKTRRQVVELTVTNALGEAGRKHGADMELLVPHLRGSAALEKLDPAAETFAKDISDLVKNLLEKNPKLKAAPVVTRSGSEFPGGTPQVPQLTRDQLKGMSPEQINEAREKGQLANLLAGRG